MPRIELDLLPSSAGLPDLSPGLRAYVARPAGDGPWPGVVMVHEAWGLDDVMKELADHLASLGYLVLAPDLYSAGGALSCLVATFRALSSPAGRAWDDLEASRRWLLAQPECTGKVGILGFCLGGGFALAAVTRGYDAAAPNYGQLPATPQALRGGCPVVASYGAQDRQLAGAADKVERALTAYDIPHDVKEYPEAGHAFLNTRVNGPTVLRPIMRALGAGPDPVAAQDAWRRIDAFFTDHLAP